MKMGVSYSVKVMVQNTGNTPEKFYLTLQAPSEYIYPDISYELFKINARSYRIFEFDLVPIKPNQGEMNLTATLYRGEPREFLPSFFEELDRTTAVVRLVQPRVNARVAQLAFILVAAIIPISIVSMALLTRRGRMEVARVEA